MGVEGDKGVVDTIPLSEYTPGKALMEPSDLVHPKEGTNDVPEHCVMPMYPQIIDKLQNTYELELIYDFRSSLPHSWGAYRLNFNGSSVMVIHPGLGAPLATAVMEEMIALGCRKFVACGVAGVIDDTLERGSIIIPSAALRDEGTSFHYVAPSRIIESNPIVVQKLQQTLQRHGVPHIIGMTWTTDAFYRETKERISRRKKEGCVTVEMECAGLLAVAQYREVVFGQYLAAWDSIGGEVWDPRQFDEGLTNDEKMFWLSVEACLSL